MISHLVVVVHSKSISIFTPLFFFGIMLSSSALKVIYIPIPFRPSWLSALSVNYATHLGPFPLQNNPALLLKFQWILLL